MSLLTRVRKWARGWRMVIPVYDAYSCPACRALVSGEKDRQWHSEKHRRDAVYMEMLHTAIMQLCTKTGLTVQMVTDQEMGEGYEFVSLHGDYDEDDDDVQ